MHKQAKILRGFTLLELAIVAVLIGVLATVALGRMGFYQEQAEKVAMEQMIGTLRSALNIQTAALIARGRTEDIPRLLEQNPMNWLVKAPDNYQGEYFAPKPQDIEPGNWYFDLKSGELVYSIHNNDHFQIEKNELSRVRFRTRLVTAIQENGKADDKVVEGTVLEPVVPYRWF